MAAVVYDKRLTIIRDQIIDMFLNLEKYSPFVGKEDDIFWLNRQQVRSAYDSYQWMPFNDDKSKPYYTKHTLNNVMDKLCEEGILSRMKNPYGIDSVEHWYYSLFKKNLPPYYAILEL